ncbi:N-alpha-acetyltransferase 35 NatC auxiliary subunit [Cichlidogyrus casuarinus]|uniref:Protein MAK10 homolog n=1 Tax=Cichlidogyrus casuarinus TaxID=1844966 RepID=A0ABD2Q6P8_9PLAT
MFAVEIMDPKLDARVRPKRKVMTVAEAIETNALELSPFEDCKQLLGVLDEQICSLVNWLSGDSLAQSVFNSMYMHCTQLVRDPYIYAFCEGLRFVVYTIRNLIIDAAVSEEEDICLQINGMPLNGPDARFTPVDTDSLEPSFVEADRTLYHPTEEALKAAINNLEKSSFSESDQYNIQIRLRFILLLLRITTSLAPFDETIARLEDIHFDNKAKEKQQHSPLNILESTKKDAENLLATVHELLATADAALRPAEQRNEPRLHEYGIPGYDLLLNICALQSLIPKTVKIVSREDAFVYMTEFVQRVLNLLNSTIELRNRHLCVPTWQCIVFLKDHSHTMSRDIGHLEIDREKMPCLQYAGSCIFTRSLLKHFLTTLDTSAYDLTLNVQPPIDTFSIENFYQCIAHYQNRLLMDKLPDFLAQDHVGSLTEIALSCSVMFREVPPLLPIRRTSPSILVEGARRGETAGFSSPPTKTRILGLVFRLYCFNRSRQRTMLESLLGNMLNPLPMWFQLDVGLFEYAKPFGNCKVERSSNTGHMTFMMLNLYYHCAWDFVCSGFQLELYTGNELLFMYTFLVQLLRTTNQCMVNYLAGAIAEDKHFGEMARGQTKNRKNHTNATGHRPLFDQQMQNYLTYQSKYLALHQNLAMGTMYALAAALRDCGLDAHAQPPSIDEKETFWDPVEMFSRRVGSLTNNPYIMPKDVKGPSESYQYFKKYVESQLFNAETLTEHLYIEATSHFRLVPTIYETMRDASGKWPLFGPPDSIEDLVILAKKNGIACSLLASAPTRRPSAVPHHFTKMPSLKRFPFEASPTQFQFGHLTSKTYPLIKFAK